jgi:hypothetical protein
VRDLGAQARSIKGGAPASQGLAARWSGYS